MRKLKLFALLAAALMTANMWAGGSCGDGLTWEINSGTKTLVISYDGVGTGVMDDYTSDYLIPWSSNRFDFFTISLPEGLTHIGDLAFKYCNMQSITIPASVTSIGKESFSICSSLTSVTFNTPSSLTTLGEKAFDATAITSITIPEGVTSIGKYCFEACDQLESITLPSTLLSMSNFVFHMCNKLKSFTLPANVNDVGLEIFFECVDMESISVDPSNTTFDSRDNCNAIIKTSTNTIIAACKNSDIPATVYSIQQEAFSGLDLGGRSIVIPEGVTHLGQSCFNSCYNASISIPKTVTSYGDFFKNPPFFGCSFSSITVDAENPKYDSRNNCNAIIETATNILVNGCQNTVIPEDVVEIGPGAFNSIHELTKITIPASVTKLGLTALANCDHLAEITCLATTPPNASASMVFWEINKAMPVYIPAGTLAAYQAAAGWKDFTNFIEIGDQPEPEPAHEWTCGGCVVTLDNGVLTIAPDPNADESSRGVMAFLSNMGKEQHDWYEYRELVTKIVMADGVTNVSDKCFYGCSNATSARISNDVIYIGINSFNGCSSLENIVIPVAVSSIDQDAFKGCTGMKDVYCYAAASWMGGNWFDENGDDFKPSKATTCHVYADQLSTFLGYWGPGGSRDDLNLTFEGNLDAVLTMSDNAQEGKIDEFLDAHDGEVIPELTITRPVYCNNYYNTICLPFDMNEEQINNSSIAGAEIKAFKAARIEGGALILTLEVTNTIEAGVPYFISYSMADALESLTFKEVKLDAAPPAQTIVSNGVKFRGTYEKFHMEGGDHSYLFLGQNNTLYWPSTDGDIKPFRAFFEIIPAANAAIRRGMPARFEDKNSTTDIEKIQTNSILNCKMIENGQLVIIRNGMKYNAAGQIVK